MERVAGEVEDWISLAVGCGEWRMMIQNQWRMDERRELAGSIFCECLCVIVFFCFRACLGKLCSVTDLLAQLASVSVQFFASMHRSEIFRA